jgi:ribosomal protein S18 acetylase RimI-like enzyme
MLSYRWMEQGDIAEVSDLAHRIWHAHYPSIITIEQIDYMLAKSYAPASLVCQMEEGQHFLLARREDTISGFLSIGALEQVAHPALRGDAAANDYFLHKFYIAPELRGKGAGKAMLKELLRLRPDIARLRLQVARKNTDAWNFYLKQGFVIEREHDFDIGDGYVMRDYVMEKRMSQKRRLAAPFSLFDA